jgi:hypothetical protein
MGLSGKHANPDLAAALDVAGDRPSPGFDLPRGEPPRPTAFRPNSPKLTRPPRSCQTAVAALVLLPEFRSLRL